MQAATDGFFPETRPHRPSRRLSNFIFFGLLGLLVLVSMPYGSVEPWWRALFECLIFVLAVLFLIDIANKGDWNLSRYKCFWPLVALIVFAFIQTIPFGKFSSPALSEALPRTISADPQGTWSWTIEMLALILLAMMLLRYVNDQRRFKWLVYVIVGIAVASAIFGVYRQMIQHQPGFFLPYLRPGIGYAQFINKNHFAFLMEMGFGLVLGLIVWRGSARDRLLLSIGAAILFGGAVVLANSRGGILSLFSELVVAALLFSVVAPASAGSRREKTSKHWSQKLFRSNPVRVVLMILFLVVVAIGVIWIGGSPLATSIEAVPTEIGAQADNSRWAVRRWDIWPATWRLIKDHPVAGVGFDGYWMAITRYHNASGEMTPQQAHNDYLEFAASSGIIGMAIAVWFVLAFLREARASLRTTDRFRRAARCGALLGLSGVAVHCFVDFGLHIPVNAAVFMTLIVISTADVAGRKQKTRPSSP
jgi:O-antigen ligase